MLLFIFKPDLINSWMLYYPTSDDEWELCFLCQTKSRLKQFPGVVEFISLGVPCYRFISEEWLVMLLLLQFCFRFHFKQVKWLFCRWVVSWRLHNGPKENTPINSRKMSEPAGIVENRGSELESHLGPQFSFNLLVCFLWKIWDEMIVLVLFNLYFECTLITSGAQANCKELPSVFFCRYRLKLRWTEFVLYYHTLLCCH